MISLDEVVAINRRTIEAFGGPPFVEPDNFLNRGSLEYILSMLDAKLFGHEMYPTVQAKAAALGWSIITGHVFHDGNKRTGMLACALVLDINGYSLLRGYDDDDAEAVTLSVAKGECRLEAFTDWVTRRATPKEASGGTGEA